MLQPARTPENISRVQHSGTTLEQRKKNPLYLRRLRQEVHQGIQPQRFIFRTQHEGSRFICGTFIVSKVSDIALFDNEHGCGKGFVSKVNLEDHIRTAHLSLPSLVNANRKKPAVNLDDEDEDGEFDFEEAPKKTRKAKGKNAKTLCHRRTCRPFLRKLTLAATSPVSSPRASISSSETTISSSICAPNIDSLPLKIEKLEYEAENEPEFQFPVGDIRNDEAYGGEGGEEDLEIDTDIRMPDLGNIPFWLGDDEVNLNMDNWGQEELDMRTAHWRGDNGR